MTKMTIGTPVMALITPGMDDNNEWPTHSVEFGRGGFKLAKTNSDLNAIPLPRRYQSAVLVLKGDDNYPHFYYWSGTKKDGSDGKWQETYLPGGFILADTDGGLPQLVHTLVAGNGLEIQPAGDQGGGAIIQLEANAGDGGSSSLTIGSYGQPSTFVKANKLEMEWPLKAWSDADQQGAARVSMQHGLWQLAEAPNYLAYLDSEEEIIVKNKVITGRTEENANPVNIKDVRAKLWFDYTVCQAGAYIELDRNSKVIKLQEADDKDPNISGGMNYYIAFVVSPLGDSPESGFIRTFVHDESKGEIATDVNGHPLAVQVNYPEKYSLMPSGNPILVTGLINEKGLNEISFNVEDNFINDTIVLGDMLSGPTGVMIQAITADSKSGTAFRQFQLDTGIKIRDEIKWVPNVSASLAWAINGHSIAPEWLAAKKEKKIGSGFTVFSLTPLSFSVSGGYITMESAPASYNDFEKYDADNVPTDFCISKILDADHTNMYRGKSVQFGLTTKTPLKDVKVSLIYWTGEPNNFPVLFDARQNGNILVNNGWYTLSAKIDSGKVVGKDNTLIGTVTLPETAHNFGIVLHPKTVKTGTVIEIKDLFFGAETPFSGVISHRPLFPSESAIEYHEEKGVFAQTAENYVSLRYTLSSTNGLKVGTPLPCGEQIAGSLDVEIDSTVNRVAGSSATGGEGALKFKNDGTFHNYYTYVNKGKRQLANSYFFVCPGEALKKQGDTADVSLFWAEVSADGTTYTKIPESETTHTVSYGDAPQIVMMKQWSHDFEGGDRIALRGYCSVDDGAYLYTNSGNKPLVNNVVYYKELTLVQR